MIMLDIDVPNDCIECPMHDGESFYCNVNKINCNMDERPRSCPIIEDDWIPCSKELPEDGVYIVYAPTYKGGSSSAKENYNGIMFSRLKKGKWSIEHGYYDRSGCVTAWRPLPEPYRCEKEGCEKDG